MMLFMIIGNRYTIAMHAWMWVIYYINYIVGFWFTNWKLVSDKVDIIYVDALATQIDKIVKKALFLLILKRFKNNMLWYSVI